MFIGQKNVERRSESDFAVAFAQAVALAVVNTIQRAAGRLDDGRNAIFKNGCAKAQKKEKERKFCHVMLMDLDIRQLC